MRLSQQLRELADEIEGTEIDDDRNAHFVTRMELTDETMWESFEQSDVNWDNVQFDDKYDNTYLASFFL